MPMRTTGTPGKQKVWQINDARPNGYLDPLRGQVENKQSVRKEEGRSREKMGDVAGERLH
jgi:hypothetical protein